MCLPLLAHAEHNHVIETAFWVQTTPEISLAQVQTQKWQPYQGILSRGFQAAPTWIRVRIDPQELTDPHDELILSIRPVSTDFIELWDPLDHSGKRRISGDHSELSAEEYPSLTHTFVIPAGDHPRDLWLQVQTTSTQLVAIEALSVRDMPHQEFRLMLQYFVVLSILFLFLILELLNWLQYKNILDQAFIVRQFLFLAFVICGYGIHRYWFSDWMSARALELMHNWLAITVTSFSIWFESQFLWEYRPAAWTQKVVKGLLLWSTVVMILMLLGETRLSLHANMILNAVTAVSFLVISITVLGQHKNPSSAPQTSLSQLLTPRWIVAYYVFVCSLLGASVLPALGIAPGNALALNVLIIYALCTGALMTVLMQLRAHQMRRINLQTQQNLTLQIQRTALETERRQEQSQLLAMLMHEIKNPLAVIDLAKTSIQETETRDFIGRNVTSIQSILDRCLQADQIVEGKLSLSLQKIDIDELIAAVLPKEESLRQRVHLVQTQSPIQLKSDLQFLSVILTNLLDNALRYSPPNSPVHIEITTPAVQDGKRQLLIKICNSPAAAGWPDPQQVFKKYYRSAGAKKSSGTGLGLYLVQRLAQTLGVQCRYVPTQEQVQFEIWIPL